MSLSSSPHLVRPPGRSLRRFFLLVLAVACLRATPAVAERAVEVFEPRRRAAADLLEPARAALEPGGRVVVDGSGMALVLVGERAAVRRALGLLERLDVPQRTVLIRHERHAESELRRSGVDIDWQVFGGGLRVGTATPVRDGLRVGTATRGRRPGRHAVPPAHRDDGVDVRVEPRSARARESSSTVSTVRVLEGRTARLADGVTVPVRLRGPWVDRTALLSAESGLEIRPVVLEDGRFRLEVISFSGKIERGLVGRDEVVATVEVAAGELVAIATVSRDETSRGASASGVRRGSDREETVLLVSARLADEAVGTAAADR